MKSALLFASVFLACAVESVEALTIVLAIGVTRQWRAAWQGVAAATLTLAVIVAALGPALSALPLNALRVVVGSLLLIFGIQWLRKAILRASGHKALHDEDAIFAEEQAAALAAAASSRAFVHDWYAFTVSFKGVLLEGLEVAFIVVTFGANARNVPVAVVGAVAAIVAVVIAGVAVRHPLARVPENTMKFAVGVMLTSFGTFWAAEGAGAHWPGDDASLPAVIGGIVVLSMMAVRVLSRPVTRSRAEVAA